jgi:hypothetical protein
MTAKNHKNPPQPATRESQTSEPTGKQYGPFTKEDVDTLLQRACKHGATKYEMAAFLAWAQETKINAALLNLIQRGDVEITDHKDDGSFVTKLPDPKEATA